MRVLVVEDHPTNRLMLTAFLSKKNLEILQAETAAQGILLAQENNPDLIFMDLGLPDLDGHDATKILKSNPATKHIPIVILTAHAFHEERIKAEQSGCDAFVTKPFVMNDIYKMLDRFSAPSV